MASVALSRAVEIGLPCLGVASYDVDDWVHPMQRGCPDAVVKKRCDIGNLRLRQSELRHAFVSAAVQDDWRNPFAIVIVENQHRSEEVRTAFSPFRVCAVAEAAGGDKCLLAPRHGDRIVHRITPPSESTTSSGGWRLRASLQNGKECKSRPQYIDPTRH